MATMQVTDTTKEEAENGQDIIQETNEPANMTVEQRENPSDNQKVKQDVKTAL